MPFLWERFVWRDHFAILQVTPDGVIRDGSHCFEEVSGSDDQQIGLENKGMKCWEVQTTK